MDLEFNNESIFLTEDEKNMLERVSCFENSLVAVFLLPHDFKAATISKLVQDFKDSFTGKVNSEFVEPVEDGVRLIVTVRRQDTKTE